MEGEFKFCDLTISTKSSLTIQGRFHVPGSLDTNLRPSDMLQKHASGYLVLTDVTVRDGEQSRQIQCVLVRADAIAYVELGSTNWKTKHGSEQAICATK